jgi:hypothetical protein
MLTAKHYSNLFADAALPKRELLEIHRSKISLHCAKEGYSYPAIRLPHGFSQLTGLSTRVYQIVHDSALAFLVAIIPTYFVSENTGETANPPSSHSEVLVRIWPNPPLFFESEIIKPSIDASPYTGIMKNAAQ